MVISAYFESAARPSASTRAKRRKLMLEVRGAHASGADVPVVVHNISETGLLIECDAALSIRDRIDIELPHAGVVPATLVWESGRMFGCQFDAPISAAALSAAQLRSAIDVEETSVTTPVHEEESVPVAPQGSNFAANLKRLRMANGLSQADVAERLGVSGPSISGWEKGRARPKEDRLADLANLLGVPVSQLLVDPQPDMIQNLIDASRQQIARATGVGPDRVRIIVEF
jgi:transcriptional regulator with XRE-family HTH domain